MSTLAGLLLIVSIVGLVKLHKGKGKEHPSWFSKRNCIIVLVVSIIIGFASGAENYSSTTPQDTYSAANSAISEGLTGSQAVASVVDIGATQSQAVAAINVVEAQQKAGKIQQAKADKIAAALHIKNMIPDTETGIISDNGGLTTLKAGTNGIMGINYTSKTYVITYQYQTALATDNITNGVGNELSSKIQAIYQKYPNVDQVEFIVLEPMQDNLGNAFLRFGVSFDFSRSLYNQVNWTSFDSTKLITIATNVQNVCNDQNELQP